MPQATIEEAWLRHRAGDYRGARAEAEALLEDEPEHAQARHLLGLLALEQDDVKGALQQLTRAREADPSSAAVLQALAGAQHKAGDVAAAVRSLEEAVRLDPNLEEAHATLGFMQFLSGDLDEAERSLRTAQRLDPEAPQVLSHLGAVFLAQGKVEQAIATLQSALEINENYVPARASLGRAFLAKGAGALAEACFRRALEQQPEHPNLTASLGRALALNGDIAGAQQLLHSVLQQNPGHYESMLGLGELALSQRDYGRAVEFLGRAQAKNPNDTVVLERLGDALQGHGRYQAAAQVFGALSHLRRDAHVNTKLGMSLLHAGEYKAARERLESAREEAPDNVHAALLLAQLSVREGQREHAMAILEDLEPPAADDPAVRVARARLALANDDAQAALAALEQVAGSEHAAEVHELRARCHDAMGNYESAAQELGLLSSHSSTPLIELPERLPRAQGARPQAEGDAHYHFLTGLPGGGVGLVAQALKRCERAVLEDRFSVDPPSDFLRRWDDYRHLDAMDSAELDHLARRFAKSWRRRTAERAEGPVIDRLPVGLVHPELLAAVLPGATLWVVVRHPSDMLLHSRSFGWRDGRVLDASSILEFHQRLLEDWAPLQIRFLSLDDGAAPLAAGLDLDAGELASAIKAESCSADGLPRYWPAGHHSHYKSLLEGAGRELDELASKLAGSIEGGVAWN